MKLSIVATLYQSAAHIMNSIGGQVLQPDNLWVKILKLCW